MYWDHEEAKLTFKVVEMDYTKNMKFVMNLDLSNNNLVSLIPSCLYTLSILLSLNLSLYQFLGEIPKNIRDMKSLEFVDFSYN